MNRAHILWLFLFSTPVAPAQIAYPGGIPVQKFAPEYARWTVTEKSREENGDNASGPRIVRRVLKTGNLRHIVTEVSGGLNLEVWCKDTFQVIVRPEWSKPVVTSGQSSEEAARFDLSGGDFPEFDWVGEKNFSGISRVQGRECLLYQDSVQPRTNIDSIRLAEEAAARKGVDIRQSLQVIACVAVDTRLPVFLQRGDEIVTYDFAEKPGVALTLPPEIEAALREWQLARQQMIRKPVRP